MCGRAVALPARGAAAATRCRRVARPRAPSAERGEPAGRATPAPPAGGGGAGGAVRQRKDPRRFGGDMDAVRAYLHDGAPPVSFAWLLNVLAGDDDGRRARGPSAALVWLHRCLTRPPPRGRSSVAALSDEQALEAARLRGISPAQLEELAGVMLTTPAGAARVCARHPEALALSPPALAARVLCLKRLLPACDVLRLVEHDPELYLAALDGDGFEERLAATLHDLREGLPGADVDAIVQHDPTIVACHGLAAACAEFRGLWPSADAETLAESEPEEIALALRALSPTGPPRRF